MNANQADFTVQKMRIAQGTAVSRKRVARLMRRAQLRGVSRRGFVVTTERNPRQRPAPDLVNRRFVADAPNRLWVADMTYVPTWSGFIYLAIMLDVWSRRVVGWSIGERMTAELVLAALSMAVQRRQPDGAIHHSDQGSQYTSVAFGARCARLALFTWIEGWYNPRRRHSALGYRAPIEFEKEESGKTKAETTTAAADGLPTGGLCVACATPPVDNPALQSPGSA
jgi:putative transposase